MPIDEEMAAWDDSGLCGSGEDVASTGGSYKVTKGNL